MQERAWEKRGEQYLLIKSPPASGKSRALMFVALDKLANEGLRQAVIVVPEKTIGASFADVFRSAALALGRLEGATAMGPLQRARDGRGQGQVGEGVPGEQRPRITVHPRDLPLCLGQVRSGGLTRGRMGGNRASGSRSSRTRPCRTRIV